MRKITALALSFLLLCSVLCGCSLIENITGNITNNSKKYEIGTNSASGWQSSWIGLQYKPSSSMVMATNEEIEKMMELGADVMFEENGKQMIDWAKVTTAYEMMATNPTNNSNVIVCAEKVALSNMTVTQYLDTVKSQLGSVYTSVSFSEPTSQDVGGISFTRVDVKTTYMGVNINQTYMVTKMHDRMISLIFTCTTPKSLDSMLAGFSAYTG